MSVWLLIVGGLTVWTVLSIALGLWLGKIVAAQSRGGYIHDPNTRIVAQLDPTGERVALAARLRTERGFDAA